MNRNSRGWITGPPRNCSHSQEQTKKLNEALSVQSGGSDDSFLGSPLIHPHPSTSLSYHTFKVHCLSLQKLTVVQYL